MRARKLGLEQPRVGVEDEQSVVREQKQVAASSVRPTHTVERPARDDAKALHAWRPEHRASRPCWSRHDVGARSRARQRQARNDDQSRTPSSHQCAEGRLGTRSTISQHRGSSNVLLGRTPELRHISRLLALRVVVRVGDRT